MFFLLGSDLVHNLGRANFYRTFKTILFFAFIILAELLLFLFLILLNTILNEYLRLTLSHFLFGLFFACRTAQFVFHLLSKGLYFSFVNFFFREQIFYLFFVFVFLSASLIWHIFHSQRHKIVSLTHFGGILNLSVHLRLNDLQLVQLRELVSREWLSVRTHESWLPTSLHY